MNKKVLSICTISLVLTLLSSYFNYIPLHELTSLENSDFHFNLLTVNSVIAGFMFTGLGLLISVSDHSLIKKLSETSVIRKKNGRITTGLKFNIISIFISLTFILKLERLLTVLDYLLKTMNIKFIISTFLINYIAMLGVFCLVMSFVYFGLSVKDINKLLRNIEDFNSNEKLSPEEVEKLKNDINN